MGDARIDQSGFLLAGEHDDGKSQPCFGAREKNRSIPRLAYGAGRHGAHAPLLEAPQTLAEALQGVPAALEGEPVQCVILQPLGEAHGLTQGLHFPDDQTLIA
ncbi:hypothetical protein D3C80_1864220 [compost metagenome]